MWTKIWKVIWKLSLALFCAYVAMAATGMFFSDLGTRRYDNYEYYFYRHPAGTIAVYSAGIITFLVAGIVIWRAPDQMKISDRALSACCGVFFGITTFLMTPRFVAGSDWSHISTLSVSAIVGVAVGVFVFVVCRRFSR